MQAEDLKYFQLLKDRLESTFRKNHPEISTPIREFSGKEIVDFQEDLAAKVQGRVSEKWFYTHIKADQTDKIPRIDMLNLLSEYTGYKSWTDFKYVEFEEGKITQREPQQVIVKKRKNWLPWVVGAFLIVGSGFIWQGMTSQKYHFCFIDMLGKTPIMEPPVEVLLLVEGESPLRKKADKSGCITVSSNIDKIVFVVNSPYYHADTIVRSTEDVREKETIALRTDDYALMIHYFSQQSVQDWERRRQQLDEMFDENARIFQVSPDNQHGIEMYTKTEFIDKLTIPINSLKNLEILETQYQKDKIIGLRFVQKNTTK